MKLQPGLGASYAIWQGNRYSLFYSSCGLDRAQKTQKCTKFDNGSVKRPATRQAHANETAQNASYV